MLNNRQFSGLDNDKVPLITNGSRAEVVELPHVYLEKPIMKGITNQFSRWPNDLSSLFLTTCFVMSSLIVIMFVVFITFVTVIICSPVANDSNRELRTFIDDHTFNVYFVKEATKFWSRKEFCYMEAAAREHPELNVYVINLARTPNVRLNMSEIRLKTALTTQIANFHMADFSIDNFFSRSMLENMAGSLNNELLLMAAKAYLLWNSPGVAMHPSAYCNLATIDKSLCRQGKRDCTPDISAIVDPMLDLQATEVHCQVFLGFLLNELSKNTTRIYSLKDALDKFCLRTDSCPEVHVIDLRSKCSINFVDCPTVYTTKVSI